MGIPATMTLRKPGILRSDAELSTDLESVAASEGQICGGFSRAGS